MHPDSMAHGRTRCATKSRFEPLHSVASLMVFLVAIECAFRWQARGLYDPPQPIWVAAVYPASDVVETLDVQSVAVPRVDLFMFLLWTQPLEFPVLRNVD